VKKDEPSLLTTRDYLHKDEITLVSKHVAEYRRRKGAVKEKLELIEA